MRLRDADAELASKKQKLGKWQARAASGAGFGGPGYKKITSAPADTAPELWKANPHAHQTD
jgi:hypothetical protein